MIVAAIIGLLATIAIPSFIHARENSQNKRFINDIRIAVGAFIQYNLDKGGYPADTTPGIIPANMNDYLIRIEWTKNTVLGGKWDWDYLQFGCTSGVSVYRPDASADRMRTIDQEIDDGDLTTGNFRQRTDGYISIIQ